MSSIDAIERGLTRRKVMKAVGRMAAVATVLIVLFAVLPFQSEKWWLGTIIGVGAVVAIAPVTIRRVAAIRASPNPVFAAVEALFLIVAMLIFGFSSLYLIIDRNAEQFADLNTRFDSVYFTVTTLGTVGFGDIHPSGQLARVIVTIQILLDFTLIAFSLKVLTATARQRVGMGQPES